MKRTKLGVPLGKGLVRRARVPSFRVVLPTPDELEREAGSGGETPMDAAEVRWDPWLLRLYLKALIDEQRQRLD